MSNAGLLSFDIYNQLGKNELYVGGTQQDFTQRLRIRIANNKRGHQINLTKKDKDDYHFGLVLKKGLLPKKFGKANIDITLWRRVEGKDLFDTSKLDVPAFDVEKIKKNNQVKINIEKITQVLDELEVKKKKATAESVDQTGTTQTTLAKSKKKTGAAGATGASGARSSGGRGVPTRASMGQ